MSAAPEFWAEVFSQRKAAFAGLGIDWLQARRERALARFMAEGWPSTRQEDWRHTSLAALANASFASGGALAVDDTLRELRAAESGHWLVFVDGSFSAQLSDIGALPAGVRLGAISQAGLLDQDLLAEIYGEAEEGHSTSALNLALASDGAWVFLPPGAQLTQPVHIACVSSEPQAAHFLRHVVYAGANSQATVVEHYLGAEHAANLRAASTQIKLEADARIEHLKLQCESKQAWHLGEIVSRQERNSYFASHSISLGGRLARHDIRSHFAAQRAELLLNGLYWADGRRHVDHHTLIDHAKPNCTSHELYRGVMADAAHGVFTGRILVEPGADGTDAVQRNDSLLLSRLAKSDARPELEIYADDVKCAHGATVGQIDTDSLFYLRARGLDEALARDILIYAFAAASVQRIPAGALRARVENLVRTILPGGVAVGEAQ